MQYNLADDYFFQLKDKTSQFSEKDFNFKRTHKVLHYFKMNLYDFFTVCYSPSNFLTSLKTKLKIVSCTEKKITNFHEEIKHFVMNMRKLKLITVLENVFY